MRKLLSNTRNVRLRTASRRALQAVSHQDRGRASTTATAIVSGTALAITGISVCCHWSPEQLALVLTATAGCTAPALLGTRG